MALAFARKSSIYSTTAASTYTCSPTWTPGANSLLVAFVVGCSTATDVDPTSVSGHGVSWSKLTLTAGGIGTAHSLSVWVADSGTASSTVACISSWSGTRIGAAVIEFEVTGADLTGGASAAIVQNPTNTGTATSGTVTSTASSAAGNRPMSFWCHQANEATTPRANWTEDATADGNFNSPATGAEGQHRADAFEITASATWVGNVAWRGIAIEIKAGVVSVTVSPAVLAAAFSIPVYTASGGAITAVGVLSALLSLPSSTAFGGARASPSVLGALFSTPAVVVSYGCVIPVSAQSALFSLIDPVIIIGGQGVTVTPEVLAALLSLPSRTIISGSLFAASPLNATFSLATPVIRYGSVIIVPVQSATFSLVDPSVLTGAIVSAGLQQLTVTLLDPNVGIGSTILINPQQAVFVLVSPVVKTGAIIKPALASTVIVTMPHPTIIVPQILIGPYSVVRNAAIYIGL